MKLRVLANGGQIFKKNDENLKKSLIGSLKEKSQQESFKTFGFSQELR
ncbi:hypothetical protein OA869_02450 [Gammaproteobacteria bacterium]|nr:hypothetical protein [Gammaproteobacteria bacterium]